ncbi:MAG TPA: hypothetical protein VHZ55_16615 [Bryobacteraceae bacterium]|jgi:type II secretory pathway component PulF|nr:hypothetical protein [Bryobacteraceae bacterium]
MTRRPIFHFKAATGFGGVVDGTVSSPSPEKLSRELIKQGLIPVRIWRERPASSSFWGSITYLLASLARRARTSVRNAS